MCDGTLTWSLGAINRHKSSQQPYASSSTSYRKSNTYINPNYKPPATQSHQKTASKHVRIPSTIPPTATAPTPSTRDVVIDGVTFESSSRCLVRKDLPKPASAPIKVPSRPIPQQEFSRTTNGHRIPAGRAYKSKVSSRTRRPRNRNMTLDNTRGPAQGRRGTKRTKYIDKPCPRFTTTGEPSIIFSGCHQLLSTPATDYFIPPLPQVLVAVA
ncbi:hypothetical protein ID866_3358 [Astraeus odoratus]|nr:hypothetical protein ID866_3358 [Astraeus odoratus]